MPLLKSSYTPPFYLRNGHVSTIVPSMFRKVNGVAYTRERIETPDDDFLDIDWIKQGNEKLVVVFHGLEGNSHRHYVKGVAKHFAAHGWDVAAWNARSCSGEMNKQPRLYHHGDVEDIAFTLDYILKQNTYGKLLLVGFSMGGAMILNYLTRNTAIPKPITKAVVISPPVDVGASAKQLEKKSNKFYRKRFLDKLKKKIAIKAQQYPKLIDVVGLDKINSFAEFDERFTAPLHGFKTAASFYAHASCKERLNKLPIPTLMLIAQNDPFMPPACYPVEEAKHIDNLFLELPAYGGHVGFPGKNYRHSWMEIRALEFAENKL